VNAKEKLRVTEVLEALEDVGAVRCPMCLTCSNWNDAGTFASGTCDFLESLGVSLKTGPYDFCSELEDGLRPYEY
jgi:hypothetical protein